MRLGLGLCLVFLDYVLGYLPGSRCLLIVLNRSFSAGCLTCLLDYLPVAFAFQANHLANVVVGMKVTGGNNYVFRFSPL
jgi:hypothetical protein